MTVRSTSHELRYRLLRMVTGNVAVVILDSSGIVLEWNAAMSRLTGYAGQDVIGAQIETLLHDSATAKPLTSTGLRNLLRAGQSWIMVEARRPDGWPIALSAELFGDAEDNSNHFSVGIRFAAFDATPAGESLDTSAGQLRALLQRLETIREEERLHLSRELHDELGQSLTALKIQIGALRSKLGGVTCGGVSCEAAPRVERMANLLDDAMHTVRAVVNQLRPPVLDTFGLIPALEWYVSQFSERIGIEATFSSSVHSLAALDERATALLRIVQELLTNAARHSQCSMVQVRLREYPAGLALEVEDNGVGLAAASVQKRGSMGLLGVRERVKEFGGTLSFHTVVPHGLCVRADSPLSDLAPEIPEPGEKAPNR